jgi:hypothetical protein
VTANIENHAELTDDVKRVRTADGCVAVRLSNNKWWYVRDVEHAVEDAKEGENYNGWSRFDDWEFPLTVLDNDDNKPLPSGLLTAQQVVDLVAKAAREQAEYYHWESDTIDSKIGSAFEGFAERLEGLLK